MKTGAVIGIIVGIAALGVGGYFIYRQIKKNKDEKSEEDTNDGAKASTSVSVGDVVKTNIEVTVTPAKYNSTTKSWEATTDETFKLEKGKNAGVVRETDVTYGGTSTNSVTEYHKTGKTFNFIIIKTSAII
jgi:hypothetical protein